MLVLSNADVADFLPIVDAIAAVRNAFLALGKGSIVMPQRLATPVEPEDATHLSMPCYVNGEDPILSHKVVTYYPNNQQHGVPTTHSVVVVHDPKTGEPLAIMESDLLTAVRTGAVSGVATQHLSRADASRLGVFGSGDVAYWQIAAACAVRAIQQVVVTARDSAKAQAFCRRVQNDLSVTCAYEPDPRMVAPTSDIVCLATTSKSPVLLEQDAKAGLHVNAVGSFRTDMCEADIGFVSKSRVVVDLISASKAGAGELIAAAQGGLLNWGNVEELSDIVSQIPVGRSDDSMTYFKSVGLAVQDAFCAQLVYERASAN